MGSASVKLNVRHARGTAGRFTAIAAITALGVAILSGLKATAPDMRRTAQAYFDEANFMDFRLLSTAGFTGDDLEAVRRVPGVRAAAPGYTADASVEANGATLVVKLISMDTGGAESINRPKLTEGRIPENPRECLADPRFLLFSGLKVGDSVTLSPGGSGDPRDTLAGDTFTITGAALCPMYISRDRGSSTIGTGAVNGYLLLPSSAFTLDCYTEICLTAENPQHLSRFDGGYEDMLKPVQDALDALGTERAKLRYTDFIDEGEAKLADARQQLADGEKKLADAAAELDDARKEIADGEAELGKAEKDFETKIAGGRATLRDALDEYNRGLAEWSHNRSLLKAGRADYEKKLKELEAAKTPLGLAGKSAVEIEAMLQAMEAQLKLLTPGSPQHLALAAQITGLRQILEGQQQLDGALRELQKGEKELAAGKQTLDDAKARLDDGRRELKQSEADGRAELDEQRRKLDDAKEELAKGEIEYEKQKTDAEPELTEARKEIADGEKQLADLKEPVWYVLDIGKNQGFAGFRQDADRIEAVSVVFPLIFFLVAALVSLTMMTRLVEDDRTLNGTLKALGYGRGFLASRYLVYAGAASLIGSAVGLAAGVNLFPRVIFSAYQILYTLPDVVPTLDGQTAWISAASAVASATLPAWAVCVQTLRASPAALMLPKAPPAGRRILLERVGFLWRRMTFTRKVTARNLFRYKKRLFMTIAGVAGCTALLLTGFGLKDSISSIVDRQFGRVRTFDVEAELRDDRTQQDLADLDAVLKDPAVTGALFLRQQSIDVLLPGGGEPAAFLVVPQRPDEFPSFVHLNRIPDGRELQLSNDAVVITQKLADKYGIRAGDSVMIRDQDGVQKAVRVGGIAENYIYHYVFVSPSLYESLYGRPPAANQLMCKVDEADADRIAQALVGSKAVLSLTKVAKLKETVHNMISALNAVVAVMILSAAALAFVVLFSLSSINIDERRRELATIKVLGFTPRELAGYIFRESTALTAIGIAVGLALGVLLEQYVVLTSEVDLVMFARDISPMSFILSTLLTFAFAALVNAAMALKLRGIDMASTLKSGE